MAWIRIEDNYEGNPKILAAGPLGVVLWLAGLSYCNRHLTDGFIPWAKAHSLVNWSYLEPPQDDAEAGKAVEVLVMNSGMFGPSLVDCAYVIRLLLMAGLWSEIPGGYEVHDYSKYQPTRYHLDQLHQLQSIAGQDRARTAKREGGRFVKNVGTEEKSPALTSSSTSSATSSPSSSTTSSPPGGIQPNPNPNSTCISNDIHVHVATEKSEKVDSARRIFNHFKLKVLPLARIFNPTKITIRLEHFSEAELIQGIDNFAADVWWMSNNAHRGANWFFHSDDRSDQFLNMKPRKDNQTNGQNQLPDEPHGEGKYARAIRERQERSNSDD